MNITEPLRRRALMHPDLPAIIRADDSVVTYAMLDAMIDAVADLAGTQGLSAGDIVGLAIDGPDETWGLAVALGLARIGVATADLALPQPHLTPFVLQADDWLTRVPTNPVPMHPGGDAVMRVLASSGTTGRSKFVPVSHRLVTARVVDTWLNRGGGAGRRMIGVRLDGPSGLPQVLRTLWQGGAVVLSNPADAVDAMARHAVRSLGTSPFSLGLILEHSGTRAGPIAGLDVIEVGGSRLPPELQRRAEATLCPHIFVSLSSTESGSIASGPVGALAGRPGAAGFVAAGVTVEAVGPDGSVLPHGVDGVLRVRSDLVVPRYFDGSPITHDGWFTPGDIGAVWPDGIVTLGGRLSDLINTGGVKTDPAVIERALLSLPGVLDAAAFGVADDVGLVQIWAAIVPRAQIDDAVLQQFCARALGDRAPWAVLQLRALPRNAAGKILRDPLIQMAEALQRA